MEIFGKHIHWHRVAHKTRNATYLECACGHRKSYSSQSGFEPIHRHWLDGGDWDYVPVPPEKPEGLNQYE